MMTTLQSYMRQGRHTVRKWALDPTVHKAMGIIAHILTGFICSAAGLGQYAMPFAVGLVLSLRCTSGALVTLGGCLGYWAFWGAAGNQPVIWLLCALGLALLLGDRPWVKAHGLFLPAGACLMTAVLGVVFQIAYADQTPIHIYLIRVALSGSSTWLFTQVISEKKPVLRWIVWAVGVLALAQIAPAPWMSLGYPAAGILLVAAPFPAAAMAGLALDLAQITPVPMTAVMALGFLYKLIPGQNKWIRATSPGILFMMVSVLCKQWDLTPLVGLLAGGVIGALLPVGNKTTYHRSQTGAAQVHLEMAAGVLEQTRQVFLEMENPPVDQDALVNRAAERACGNCPCRKHCKDAKRMGSLPGMILQKPLVGVEELPVVCKKSGRFLHELHRAQDQLRSIRADRHRQREYRAAVVQQYGFLSEYLQNLSDRLSRRTEIVCLYEPTVEVYGNRPEADNGDKCIRFSGVSGRYYVVLCDGMGTGLGAVHAAKAAGNMLRKLLCAGYPAEHALRSLNSLCALSEHSGAVTVDLAELELDTGKATVYKWGAAPSYLVCKSGVDTIGTATPPPGLSVTDVQEERFRLSLRRSERLVLISDGVSGDTAPSVCAQCVELPSAELGTRLLAGSRMNGQDDATAVIIQLVSVAE